MEILSYDKKHLWHPYTSISSPNSCIEVVSAEGCSLRLNDGRELIDGMSSWWCMVHGYNHPKLNDAVKDQLDKMAHVMFGGITHAPAVKLAKKLIDITPQNLQHVFFADSGSVAVEVAIKMAMQYWIMRGNGTKKKLLTSYGGYHGDTTGGMSVTDPNGGMHSLFTGILPNHFFAPLPEPKFEEEFFSTSIDAMIEILKNNHNEIAAIIIEPIVQGAGGMRFYHPQYLKRLAEAAKEYDVLLILDEIATGFWRTGKMFACEHANIEPDIMCLGKALTGGYMTLSATLSSSEVANTVGTLMHGPTFMANPLACAVANASVEMLSQDYTAKILHIENILKKELEACRNLPSVADVRVMGAIGVVEMKENVDMSEWQAYLIKQGVWLRPFGKLVYMMPPYVISDFELQKICLAVYKKIASDGT